MESMRILSNTWADLLVCTEKMGAVCEWYKIEQLSLWTRGTKYATYFTVEYCCGHL